MVLFGPFSIMVQRIGRYSSPLVHIILENCCSCSSQAALHFSRAADFVLVIRRTPEVYCLGYLSSYLFVHCSFPWKFVGNFHIKNNIFIMYQMELRLASLAVEIGNTFHGEEDEKADDEGPAHAHSGVAHLDSEKERISLRLMIGVPKTHPSCSQPWLTITEYPSKAATCGLVAASVRL